MKYLRPSATVMPRMEIVKRRAIIAVMILSSIDFMILSFTRRNELSI